VDFDRAVAELDALVATLEREGDERALLLLELVDSIHRPALELIARGELDHPIARALLAMYDLADVDEVVEVEEALDEVRPYVEGHGGKVELLGVEAGVVHVRMSGACQGCAASALTLRRGIEEALRRHYEGFREVVSHELDDAPGPVGSELPMLDTAGLRRPVFVEVAERPAPGEMRSVVVEDVPVLLVNVEEELYAFRNACPVDGLPLDGGRIAGGVLVCPWHNCAYEARTGRRADGEGDGLAVVPIAFEDGAVQVAVNVA
jgi:Fe-S cluster biogenesis protein NfuA/nitrite reductase/ring-hydroxylating ferredoxin subunit